MTEAAAIGYDWPPMRWTGYDVIAATDATANTVDLEQAVFDAVCTDSRQVTAGVLFVALRGRHFDGHNFAAEALRHGAAAALVEQMPPGCDAARTLVVRDTLRALGDLAAWTRRQWPVRVVGVTGSNGKTTTKEILAAIAQQVDFSPPRTVVLKSRANENNLIGLPLNLLRLTGHEAVAVLEMGMNVPGEIARLAEIAAPDVGVITNIGPAHLEGVGSLAGVAAAKGELFAGMRHDATIAVNRDDEWVRRVAASFPGRRIEFGRGGEITAGHISDFGLDGVAFTLTIAGWSTAVRLRMPGEHNVTNALAAAAAAHGLGIECEAIAAGVAAALPPPMRMQVIRLANGRTVVNDAYNANPASMEMALRLIARTPSRTLAVLGEMRELGAESAALHQQLGRQAARSGIRLLVLMGPQAESVAAGARATNSGELTIHTCASAAAAAEVIADAWQRGDTILVKGSRGPDTEESVRRYGARLAEVVSVLAKAGGGR